MCTQGRGRLRGAASWSVSALLLLAIPPLWAQSNDNYAGAETCTKCHAGVQHEAAASRHSKMMQPATRQAVEGDFSIGKVAFRGSTYLLRESGGTYYITESDLTGKAWEHK